MSKTKETPFSSDLEEAVLKRYAEAARKKESALCCPTDFSSEDLAHIPEEVLEKDYGCGNPSRWAREGEVVVDLGSGAGKMVFLLAKKVGPKGKVMGVDMNDEMLAVARRAQPVVAQNLGYANTTFFKGKIQDLALNWEKAEDFLRKHPITDFSSFQAWKREEERLRREEPLIPSDSVDLIVSNCVLNLVPREEKPQLFREMYRVLKKGGRCVISDIVCDEDPPPELLNDPELWSGCISGAFREDLFFQMFEEAGFYGMEVLDYQEKPWQVIEGIEFRSWTIQAFKGKEGPCLERHQAVIYRGPWKAVMDDDGHTYYRGKRMAVCDKTYHILTDAQGPYAGSAIPVPPRKEVPLEEAKPFSCQGTQLRPPSVTKGKDYRETVISEEPCCSDGDCC